MVLKAKDESNSAGGMIRQGGESCKRKGRRQEGAIIEGLRRRTRGLQANSGNPPEMDDVEASTSSALVPA